MGVVGFPDVAKSVCPGLAVPRIEAIPAPTPGPQPQTQKDLLGFRVLGFRVLGAKVLGFRV